MNRISLRKLSLILAGCFIFILISCENKSSYVSINNKEDLGEETFQKNSENDINENTSFTIPYKLLPSGIKTIHVKFNDSASFDAIFDTGCSGVLISIQEAMSLVKSGTLSQKDILGNQQSSIASGEIMENQIFNIHEISIFDINGKPHRLNDIPVTVVENPGADVLIGNCVIDRLANNFYTIDLRKQVIIFQ